MNSTRIGYNNLALNISTDISECKEQLPCHAKASCTNAAGSYNCACKAGYTGNGITCAGHIFNYWFHNCSVVLSSVLN